MLEAMHACNAEDAELFTPEDNLELQRVNQVFMDQLNEPRITLEQDFFTSGLYMHDYKEWKWIGSGKEMFSLSFFDPKRETERGFALQREPSART